nr:unnamed protein product [Callosobruchus analis]
MSDLRNVSREFLTEFIELYRQFTCLWHTSLKSDGGTGERYRPALWYYDLLLFLNEQDMPRNSISNISNIGVGNEEGNNSEDEETGGDKTLNMDEESHDSTQSAATNLQTPFSHNSSVKSSSTRPPKKCVTYDNPTSTTNDILGIISRRLEGGEKTDEFDAVGTNIACKLRRISETSAQTRVFAEKLINDVLYYADLGNLNENSRIALNHHAEAPQNHSIAHPQTASTAGPEQYKRPPTSTTPGECASASPLTALLPYMYTTSDASTNVRSYVQNFLLSYLYSDATNGSSQQ